MRRFCSDNNNFPYDNNILVLDMVLGSLWDVVQPINWDNVAKLVPGFTPKEVTERLRPPAARLSSVAADSSLMCSQCSSRFEELKSSGAFPHVDYQCNTLTEGRTPAPDAASTLLNTEAMIERDGSSQSKIPGQSVFADFVGFPTNL